jgi:GDP-L-fucose synthase
MVQKILVTGGSGMVGKAIYELVKRLGCENTYTFISSKDYDLTDSLQVDKCFASTQYDMVIHLAAVVGGLYKNMDSNIQMFNDNILINMNILQACHKYNVNRGIFCLSSCIYPASPKRFPMLEEDICSSEPHNSNEGYAYAKRMMYILCKHYNKSYNREYICVSPVNLYGPYDNFNIKEGHVIPGLINRMYKTIMKQPPYENSEKFEVFGSGNALRQFLYVEDFASVILSILYNENVKDGIYNICHDNNEYTIREVVQIIANNFEYPIEKIEFNSRFSDGIIKKTVSNKRMREIFPEFNFTEFHDGVKKTVEWFKLNNSCIRE